MIQKREIIEKKIEANKKEMKRLKLIKAINKITSSICYIYVVLVALYYLDLITTERIHPVIYALLPFMLLLLWIASFAVSEILMHKSKIASSTRSNLLYTGFLVILVGINLYLYKPISVTLDYF